MTTLGDVKKKMHVTQQRVELFGSTKEFAREYDERIQQLGAVIAEEADLPLEEARNLDDAHPLGERASVQYAELEAWLSKD